MSWFEDPGVASLAQLDSSPNLGQLTGDVSWWVAFCDWTQELRASEPWADRAAGMLALWEVAESPAADAASVVEALERAVPADLWTADGVVAEAAAESVAELGTHGLAGVDLRDAISQRLSGHEVAAFQQALAVRVSGALDDRELLATFVRHCRDAVGLTASDSGRGSMRGLEKLVKVELFVGARNVGPKRFLPAWEVVETLKEFGADVAADFDGLGAALEAAYHAGDRGGLKANPALEWSGGSKVYLGCRYTDEYPAVDSEDSEEMRHMLLWNLSASFQQEQIDMENEVILDQIAFPGNSRRYTQLEDIVMLEPFAETVRFAVFRWACQLVGASPEVGVLTRKMPATFGGAYLKAEPVVPGASRKSFEDAMVRANTGKSIHYG